MYTVHAIEFLDRYIAKYMSLKDRHPPLPYSCVLLFHLWPHTQLDMVWCIDRPDLATSTCVHAQPPSQLPQCGGAVIACITSIRAGPSCGPTHHPQCVQRAWSDCRWAPHVVCAVCVFWFLVHWPLDCMEGTNMPKSDRLKFYIWLAETLPIMQAANFPFLLFQT